MKFSQSYRRNLIKCPIAILAVIVIVLIILLFPQKKDTLAESAENTEVEVEYISINHLLSNEMSDLEETEKLDNYITKFLRRWEIKGASLAVMKDGKLIYSKGYGWADEEEGVLTNPSHIFRIASLSKLITAAAIMKLQEDSLLSLSDKVFGEEGLLDCPEFSEIKDKRIKNITVDQLLRHQAGFTMGRGDPLFITREIMIWEKLDTVPDTDRVIKYALKQRLGYAPGSSSRYSNLGYLILSKIVEVCSGMKYEDYCQEKILHPAGCYDMHIARNLYELRYPNEVRYYETHDAQKILAYDNSGDSLYRRYGGSNIEGLSGAGAWLSSPSEFVRFVASIDGRNTFADGNGSADGSGDSQGLPQQLALNSNGSTLGSGDITCVSDILSPESIAQMISHYPGQMPIGWVRAGKDSDWLRTGTLAGTSAIAKNQRNGYIWMFVTNTSSWKGSRFTRYIESMFRRASSDVDWPDRDLWMNQANFGGYESSPL